LLASFLSLTDRWFREPEGTPGSTWPVTPILLGIVAGLIVLTRHTNALFLVLFPLHGVTSSITLRRNAVRLVVRWRDVAIMTLVGIAVLVPQLAIYREATGRFFVSSYGTLGFTFASPHIWGVLFSVQKGLFFWSPLLLAASAGLVIGDRAKLPFLSGTLIVLVLDTYLIASWWDWQFGASYGHRGFVDVFPLFAFGLATFFEWSAAAPIRKWTVTLATVAALSLSLVQMLQYWNGVLPMSDTTWSQYRDIFLRLH
jgi:hypothetical protein